MHVVVVCLYVSARSPHCAATPLLATLVGFPAPCTAHANVAQGRPLLPVPPVQARTRLQLPATKALSPSACPEACPSSGAPPALVAVLSTAESPDKSLLQLS